MLRNKKNKHGKNKSCYTVLRQHADGHWAPIVGLAYASRQNARRAVSRVAERQAISKRPNLALKVGVLR